jgi:hypothetical protein
VIGGFEKIPVLTGESNKNYVVIIEGLGEDDHVALMDPFADKEEEDNGDQKTE